MRKSWLLVEMRLLSTQSYMRAPCQCRRMSTCPAGLLADAAGSYHGLTPTYRQSADYGVMHVTTDKSGRVTDVTIWRAGFMEEREVLVGEREAAWAWQYTHPADWQYTPSSQAVHTHLGGCV